jgi:hypothetical protein
MSQKTLARLEAELTELRTKVQHLEAQQTPGQVAPQPVNSRRRVLKKLAAGIVGVGAAVALTTPAQARVIVPGGAIAPAFGAIILRPGATFSGAPPVGGAYGIVGSSIGAGSDLNLGTLPAQKVGVLGTSDNDVGVLAASGTGAPLGIVPGPTPAAGVSGQFYVASTTGNLFFYRGGWQQLFPAAPTGGNFVTHPSGAGDYAIVAAGVFKPNPDLSSPTNPIFVPEGTANYNKLECLTSFTEFALNGPEFRFKFNGYENLSTNPTSKYIVKVLPYYLGTYPPTAVNGQLIVNFGRFTTNDFSLVFGTPGFMVSNNQTPFMRFMVEVSQFKLG